jgi:hypothetical protein
MRLKDLKQLVWDLNYGTISEANFLLQVQLTEKQLEVVKAVAALPHGVGSKANLGDMEPR